MKVYEPITSECFEFINCSRDADYEIFVGLDGSPQRNRWNTVKVTRIREDEGEDLARSDFPCWPGSSVLVFGSRAVGILGDMLDAQGELLPLTPNDSSELFVFNAQSIDALDEEQCNLWRIPGSERIGRIEKLALKEDDLRGVDIFRLPHRGSATYVSQRFVDQVGEAGLVGLDFPLVWSPD